MEKIKIIYLTGYWYSGATIIGRSIASSIDGIYVGEIRDYWVKGIKQNRKCSCGEKFNNCAFWKEITNEYTESFTSINLDHTTKKISKFEKIANYFELRKYVKNDKVNSIQKDVDNYLTHTEKIYELIAKHSGKNIIVDSSRLPIRLLALSLSEKLEIYPIYVIRDPRGVINSLFKKDIRDYGEIRHSIFTHILTWNLKNFLSLDAMRIIRSPREIYMLYKTFTEYTSTTFANLEKILKCKFKSEKENGKVILNLEQGHVFTGNRSRYDAGKVTISEDTKWKDQLSTVNKIIISIGTLPIYKFIVKKFHLMPLI